MFIKSGPLRTGNGIELQQESVITLSAPLRMGQIHGWKVKSHSQVPTEWERFLSGKYNQIVRSPQNRIQSHSRVPSSEWDKFLAGKNNHTARSPQNGIDFQLETIIT